MRTTVYVDAFNLYYGCVRHTRYKWLDLLALCQRLLPKNDIRWIKYFTARVRARDHDPLQPVRQQTYIRALQTLGCVDVYYGHYLSHPVTMRLVTPAKDGSRFAEVIKSEEKGSDVNLATQLLCDAYEDKFDVAVLITNDSDLLMPLKVVKERLHKPVGVVCPHPNPAVVLRANASFFRKIRPSVLADSQFPRVLSDQHGEFSRPTSW